MDGLLRLGWGRLAEHLLALGDYLPPGVDLSYDLNVALAAIPQWR